MYGAAASSATAINTCIIKKKFKPERFVAEVKPFIN